ncbi:MAG: hypothetical protein DRN66_01110 [Candidatus Nanohalarchaeota archaeon]|nr:MAG: hypothetical protein DRN66_01110 [Candidatus Nanohaloarchaeota archaeon]
MGYYSNKSGYYKPIFILMSVFCFAILLLYNHPAESLNISQTLGGISSAGSSILGHLIGIKDNIVQMGYRLTGKKEREKKEVVLTIIQTYDHIEVPFSSPVELSINYKQKNTFAINPLLIDVIKGDSLTINNFTGITVTKNDFNYKGQCSSFWLNQNKIHLQKQINKINIEGKKEYRDSVLIKDAKINELDLKNISGSIVINGENIMNIEFSQKPMHIEDFEGHISITKSNILFTGTIEYLKAQNFVIE